MEKIVTPVALAIVFVATLTTIFGRKGSPAVIDSLGNAFGGSISAALGKGVNIS